MRSIITALLLALAISAQGQLANGTLRNGTLPGAGAAGGGGGGACSTTTDSTIGSASIAQQSVGQAPAQAYDWYASAFVVGASDGTPCKIDLVLQKAGLPTWNVQVAIYNDSTPSGTPGTINGAFSANFALSGLSTSLTTNTITLGATTPLTAGVTNYIVFKCIGSPGNFSDYFKYDTANSAQQGGYNSSNGTTWALENGQHIARFTLYK